MMELNNNPKQCENCCHTRVCSLKDKLKAYIEEYDMLNKKYGDFFPKNPNCPEYLSNNAINKHYHEINTPNDKIDKETSDAVDKQVEEWVKRLKDSPFVCNGEPIKITFRDSGRDEYERNNLNFIDEDKCCEVPKLTEEDFVKVLENILNCGF